MEARRGWLRAVGAAAGIALLALVLVPLLLRDRIDAGVQAGLSRTLAADVRWGELRVSLLRDFPRGTLRLEDLAVTGRSTFAGDTLLHVPRLRLVVGLPSVWRSVRGTGPLEIRSVIVDGPVLNLRVLDDGSANWAIFPERAAADESAGRAVALDLRHFQLRDGAVSLDNPAAGLHASVAGLTQTLRGDFGSTRFRVVSRTSSTAASLRLAGVPYLHRTGVVIDAEFDVDLEAARVTLARTDVRLNELPLALSGNVEFGDAPAIDLALNAPGASFHEVLSLLPALHAQPGFAELNTSGTVAVTGSVRGRYGPGEFPAFELRGMVRDGRFQYPDLPLPARAVEVDVALTNPGGDADRTELRVDRFRVIIGSDPVAGRFTMTTPISDPAVDLRLEGRLDLAALHRTVKLPDMEELTGSVAADIAVRGRRSDYDAGRFDRVAAEGTVRASQIAMNTTDLPHALQVEEAVLRISPQHAELESFRGRVGRSDMTVTGRFDNLLGFAFREEVLRGSARVVSDHFDLNEWRSDDELQVVLIPRNLDFALDAHVARLAFAALDLRNARGTLRIRDQRATLDDFRLELFDGSMAVSGYYESTMPTHPAFAVDVRLAAIDVAAAALGLDMLPALAPAARYAQGRLSTDLRLSGRLGEDMTPVYEVLSGRGTFETAGLSLHGFPALAFLAERLNTEQLRNPTMVDVRSSFSISDGRLHVSPFDFGIGAFAATVSGSHGFDESLDYTVALRLPRTLLGTDAQRAVATLASQAGRAGFDWQAADEVTVGVRLTGSVSQPALATDLRESTATALRQTGDALRSELEQRTDAARDEARARAGQEAARIIEEAERQAERIRAEAEPLAERTRREGYERADALVAQAGNPAARVAARAAADRMRREADAAADRILREADERAVALVEEARRRAAGGDG